MTIENHSFMDGKVHLYKRGNSRFWQCSTYMDGRNHRISTKEEILTIAKEFAREWYMAAYVDSRRHNQQSRVSRLLNKFGQKETPLPNSSLPTQQTVAPPIQASGHTFRAAADRFMHEYEVMTQGQRNKAWTEMHKLRIRVHLMPFFEDIAKA